MTWIKKSTYINYKQYGPSINRHLHSSVRLHNLRFLLHFFCEKLVSFKLPRECLSMNENSTEYVMVYRGATIGKTRNNVVLPIFYGIKKVKDKKNHTVYSTKTEHILLLPFGLVWIKSMIASLGFMSCYRVDCYVSQPNPQYLSK